MVYEIIGVLLSYPFSRLIGSVCGLSDNEFNFLILTIFVSITLVKELLNERIEVLEKVLLIVGGMNYFVWNTMFLLLETVSFCLVISFYAIYDSLDPSDVVSLGKKIIIFCISYLLCGSSLESRNVFLVVLNTILFIVFVRFINNYSITRNSSGYDIIT